MTPERWQQIKNLLQSSLEAEPAKRSALLAAACGDDESLLAEVQSLLRSHEQAGNFIEDPAVAVMAESLVDNRTASIGETLGHFRILQRLAAGGMGEVYLTEDTRLTRKVALKLLPACFTTDAQRVRRFQQEARAVSALNHPNIVTIYDIGQIDSHHFIATEFIDGETLRRRMTNARLTSGDALEITSQVASALVAAHRAGIVHRDIKPENIMLRQDGLLKVLDFGLAKLIERGDDPASLVNTNQGIVMGTAQYMSPEQARGLAVDERTDIWSLGVVLYEMLSGRVPFAGETSTDVIVSILEKEPPPLAESAPEVPAAWQQIITRMLSKDRSQRYQTPEALIGDLQSLKPQLEFAAAGMATGKPNLPSPTPAKRETSRRHSEATVASLPDSDRSVRHTVFTRFNAIVVAAALLALIVTIAYLWLSRTKPVETATGIKSIAVLPFKPLVVERPDESLEMGIADTLITKLSGLRQITVRPISAVRKYTAIEQDPVAAGSELGVDAVLEGSIQWDEEKRIRVTARLWRVRDRSLIWTDNWVEPRADIFALEDLITARMARAIEPTLTGTEQKLLTKHYTENVEAYQLYLKGRYDLKKRSEAAFTEAIMYFSQAITKDPQYALAYAGLADSYILLGVGDYGVLAPKEAMARAKESAKKALELDDKLAEAHASFGFLNYVFDWDWAGAETHFRRAIELNPNYATAHHWYALFLATQGRPVESIPEARQALALDPLSPIINTDLGLIFYYSHQYDQAIEQLQKTLELEPDFAVAHWRLGLSYAQKGRLREAEEEIRRATELAGRPPGLQAALGYVVGSLGKKDEAGRILHELQGLSRKRYVFPNFVANVYLGLKQNDQALNWLQRAYEDRCAALIGMKVEPMYDPLRSDPRFQDLMKRVGFGS